jgi:hypothetical protein
MESYFGADFDSSHLDSAESIEAEHGINSFAVNAPSSGETITTNAKINNDVFNLPALNTGTAMVKVESLPNLPDNATVAVTKAGVATASFIDANPWMKWAIPAGLALAVGGYYLYTSNTNKSKKRR